MERIRKRTDNIPLLYFIWEYSRYHYLYFFTTGKDGQKNLLITYTYDGEINHNQSSTHNMGKSRDKSDMNVK